jgi:uncharacterized protein (TIGR03437 family)
VWTTTKTVATGSINGVARANAGTDSQGNLYVLVTGLVPGVPKPGSIFTGANWGAYLQKLAPAGDKIVYQTMLSSPVNTMAVDSAGNTYLAGGNSVEKLSADGTTVLYQTTIGGQSLALVAVALDESGRIYVTGQVNAGDLPVTPGAFQQTAPGSDPNGFVVRLKANGAIDYATYLLEGLPAGIAVDQSGSAFVTGVYFAGVSSYLTRLAPDGSGLIYSTITGEKYSTAGFVAVDAADNAVVALDNAGGAGVSVIRFNPQGTGVVFSKTLPGVSPAGLAVDSAGDTYVTFTSMDANFPTKNTLASCTNAGSALAVSGALVVLDGAGALLQSTYLPGAWQPAGLLLTGASTVYAFHVPNTAYAPPYIGFLAVTRLSRKASAQVQQLACVGNAAGYDGAEIAPGEIVSLFGSGLGPSAGTQPHVDIAIGFPSQLANVQVTFNGTPAPLLYVQDSQINAVAPWSLQAGQTAQVCVLYNGAPTNCVTEQIAAADPGVFTVDGYHAAALNEDGTLNSAAHPATVGSTVSIFATGLGPIGPPQPDGAVVGFPLPANLLPVTVQSYPSESLLTVTYAGPAPFAVAGLTQINFKVDRSEAGSVPAVQALAVGLPVGQAVSNGFVVYVTP